MNLHALSGAAAVAIGLAACSPLQVAVDTPGQSATSTLPRYDPGTWMFWGGDPGQTRYAPLDQIGFDTVNRLQIAWRWSADTSGSPASSSYKSTPLLVHGVLYVPWMNHGMAAIDAGTGETIWTFEAPAAGQAGPAQGASLHPRSLAYWTDGEDERLFHNSLDGRLISVDAKTGKADTSFGTRGVVDLSAALTEGRAVTDVRSVSPAIVVGDVIVVQTIPGGSRNKESTPGDIRGFDVRTGELVWTFHVVPQPGEFGNETWENGSWAYAGQAGSWTLMSADREGGYVYIATETPSSDYSGVERPGDGLFAESIVCLDARTGERVWHFQTVHHGIWDYDNPAAPILHDIVRDGRRIKAVSLLTKQSFVFAFDRYTGEPVWPIEERPVPQDGLPGEQLSPTQPFPTLPEPLQPLGYDEDQLIDFTPELRREAVEIMRQYKKGPLYTPVTETRPGTRGTLINPGFGGGANWNGGAVDPVTNMLYVPIRYRPHAIGVRKGDPANTNLAYVVAVNEIVGGPRGLPLLKPPYSEVVAVDMNTGQEAWRIPLGTAPDSVRNHPDLQGLNLDFERMGMFDIRPSPLLTEELLFLGESGNFAGGTGTDKFRAYDKTSGSIVFETRLPAFVSGAPMTYMHDGRQYIVVAVSGNGMPAEIVALTLDGISENGPPPPGGVPLSAAPPFSGQRPTRVEATREELQLGESVYARSCAACHGATGEGGIGPVLADRSDFANIARIIAQGQGEMPALGPTMSPAEVDATAKYVSRSIVVLTEIEEPGP